MAISWPSKFPKPTLRFSGKVGNSTMVSKMDTGRQRQRRRFTSEIRTYSAAWEMTTVQFDAFQSWVKYKLHNGADSFMIDLPVGGTAFKTVEAKMVQGLYTWDNVGVMTWNVKATLLVEDALVMSEANLNTYLAS